MHHSRLCAVLIDYKTSDLEQAARFWSEALGRPVDQKHPNSRSGSMTTANGRRPLIALPISPKAAASCCA
jgi:hypothetical protein